jgi:hypothetical protein
MLHTQSKFTDWHARLLQNLWTKEHRYYLKCGRRLVEEVPVPEMAMMMVADKKRALRGPRL